MSLNILLEVKARLLIGGLIKEQCQLTTSLTEVSEEDATHTTHLRRVGDGVFPQLLLAKQATVGKAYRQCGIDIEHRPLKGKKNGLALWIRQIRVLPCRLRREDQERLLAQREFAAE